MARGRRGIYTETIVPTYIDDGAARMTDSNQSRVSSLLFPRVVATVLLIAAAMLLTACTTPAPPPAATMEPVTAAAGQRSSRSTGIAYRNGPVYAANLALPQVSLDGGHRLGNAQARIGIVEYSDYQCSYCRGFHQQIFPELKKEYIDTGIAQFIHKDLPLRSIHPQALPAALAANCAGAQNYFWQMTAALYANQGRLDQELYPQLGRELGLDDAKFTACRADAAGEQAVMRDVAEARGLNISGTPSFVIGKIEGNMLTVVRVARGAPDFGAFVQEIEKLRKQLEAGTTPETR